MGREVMKCGCLQWMEEEVGEEEEEDICCFWWSPAWFSSIAAIFASSVGCQRGMDEGG